MISGTLSATTTPASLQGASALMQEVGDLKLQVIGTGTVIVGSQAGVAAGNGVQLTSTNGPVSFAQYGGLVNLADVWVASTTGTVAVMFTGC